MHEVNLITPILRAQICQKGASCFVMWLVKASFPSTLWLIKFDPILHKVPFSLGWKEQRLTQSITHTHTQNGFSQLDRVQLNRQELRNLAGSLQLLFLTGHTVLKMQPAMVWKHLINVMKHRSRLFQVIWGLSVGFIECPMRLHILIKHDTTLWFEYLFFVLCKRFIIKIYTSYWK